MSSLFPTSFAQRRLWFIQTMLPSSSAYNMLYTAELAPPVNAPALQEALNGLGARHEALRTAFILRGSEPQQAIERHIEIPLVIREGEVNQDANSPAYSQGVSDLVSRPFDLTHAPLVRAELWKFTGAASRLCLVIHHIACDAQSMRILIDDLARLYHSRLTGCAADLLPPSIQYAEFAVWQRRMLSGPRLKRLNDYWLRRLDKIEELKLAYDRPRPARGTMQGDLYEFAIPKEIVLRLRRIATQARTTLFATLLAGFSAVLGRLAKKDCVTIGVPVSGRQKPELQRVVGLFVNSLVFRADISGDPVFRDLVARISATLAEDLSHQEMPFDLLVEALGTPRQAGRNPVFQVMFQLQVRESGPASPSQGPVTDPNPTRVQLSAEATTSQLDLSLIHVEAPDGGVEGGAVFARELCDRSTIRQWVGLYLEFLAAASSNSGLRLSQLLDSTGVNSTFVRLSPLEVALRQKPAATCLHELFKLQADATPEATAVVDEGRSLTFGELDRLSDSLTVAFGQRGVARGDRVALILPRSADCIITLMAVLKAGASYVFFSPNDPASRLRDLVADCDPALVIGREELGLGRHFSLSGDIDQNDSATSGNASNDVRTTPSVYVSSADAAYVIYTSGSTGKPKGVLISHHAIVNHMRWMLKEFQFAAGGRILQRTPLSFDASVWEVFGPLLSGATLVLAPEQRLFDPEALLQTIQRERITVLQVVPSLLAALVRLPQLSDCHSLKLVFCGGEAVTAQLRDRFFAVSSAELCNLYGPTETTIDATFHVCARNDRRPFVPIGRPISGVIARVLDPQKKPVADGTPGELYIGGSAVGIGYLNRPALTSERFIDDPFSPGGRLYRSGDQVRRLGDGDLQFLGRIDEQVKIRGFRIEPGEVEATLLRCDGIWEAAVVAVEAADGDTRLVAFVTPSTSEVTAAELRAWLTGQVPDYMVPSAIEIATSLPKTPHGKIDRASLRRDWMGALAKPDPLITPPRDTMERAICQCYERVLRRGHVGLDDDFFHLGGHSLLVVALRDELSNVLGRQVSIVDIFEFPSPRELSQHFKCGHLELARTERAGRNQIVEPVFLLKDVKR